MATIAATITYVKNGLLIDWGTLDVGDDGEWVEVYDWPTLTGQPFGNVDMVWDVTNDLAVAAGSINAVSTLTVRYRYIRPRHDGAGLPVKPRLFASRQI